MRTPIPTLVLTACVAIITIAASCNSSSQRESWPNRVVVLVRHAEKCLAQGDDPALSEEGRQRSEALARMLKDAPLGAIYSTPFQRTRESAEPTARLHGLDIIDTPVSDGFLGVLAEGLRTSDKQFVLVSGHSNTTPALVNLLAGTDLPSLSEETYDLMYVVTLSGENDATVLPLRYGNESGTNPGC